MEWAARQNIHAELVGHLDTRLIKSGDTVIGSLPINLAAQVCTAGARYLHLALEVPAELRGCELSADQLEQLGARLQEFEIKVLP